MRLFSLFISCSVLISLAFASTSPAKNLKIATIVPEGAFELVQMRQAAHDIAKETQNRVKLKFYPGGVMGNDQAVIRKIRFKQLQGGLVSSGSLASFDRNGQVYCLPFIFRSFAEVDYVRKRMDTVIINGYRKAGFTIFGLAEGGFAHILSQQPIRTVADLRQQKVWAPEKDLAAITAIQAYDIRPIPLAIADVRTGLQTGLINTVAIPPAYSIILQWHTQVQYITDLPLLYTYGIMAIDNKVFDHLKPEDQQVMTKIISAAFSRIDRHNRQQNTKALQTLKDLGLTFIHPNNQAIALWKEKAATVANNLIASGEMSKDIVDKLQKYLAEFRATQQLE